MFLLYSSTTKTPSLFLRCRLERGLGARLCASLPELSLVVFFFCFLVLLNLNLFLKKIIFREGRREGERERNIDVWLARMHSQLGTWPATQALP